MTAQNKNPLVSQIESFDPFPEPHTFPSGWDLSELYREPRPASIDEQDFPINPPINHLGEQTSGCVVDK